MLAACESVPSRAVVLAAPTPERSTATAAVAGPAANDNLNAVAWMQTSVEFRLLAGQAWRSALMQLDRAIKTPGWDALSTQDRNHPSLGLPLAVIVDVDETVLDNSPYQARLIRDGRAYDESTWSQWEHLWKMSASLDLKKCTITIHTNKDGLMYHEFSNIQPL